jgi:acetoin utilization protein AcuB
MRIAEVMTRDVISVTPEMPAFEAWDLMKRKGIRHLVVREADEIVGVLSQRDAGGRFGSNLRASATVGDLMTTQLVVVEPETTVRRVASLMRGRTVGSVLVMTGRRLRGIVTVSDLLKVVDRDCHVH